MSYVMYSCIFRETLTKQPLKKKRLFKILNNLLLNPNKIALLNHDWNHFTIKYQPVYSFCFSMKIEGIFSRGGQSFI